MTLSWQKADQFTNKPVIMFLVNKFRRNTDEKKNVFLILRFASNAMLMVRST